jgi:hypothetical protein
MENYVCLQAEVSDPGTVVLGALRDVDRDFELKMGVSRKESFPASASYSMDPDFGIRFQDALKTADALVVVSERLKQFLESEHPSALSNVEFLAVTIEDHKARPVDQRYFILHTTMSQDCIDEDASVFVRYNINPDSIAEMYSLSVDEECVDSRLQIFRLTQYKIPVIVRRDLADAITESGFTGIRFNEIDEYDHFAML